MKWFSRDYVHFDRVATPWLIKRFVDPDAEFILMPWGAEEACPIDAIPYAIPNVELSDLHDGSAPTFQKVIAKYNLTDPALHSIGRLVEVGVNYSMNNIDLPLDELPGSLAEGVMAVALGFMLLCRSDAEQFERGFVLYDALYEYFRMHVLMEERGLNRPDGVSKELWRVLVGLSLAKQLRPSGSSFSDVQLTDLGSEFEHTLAEMGPVAVTASSIVRS